MPVGVLGQRPQVFLAGAQRRLGVLARLIGVQALELARGARGADLQQRLDVLVVGNRLAVHDREQPQHFAGGIEQRVADERLHPKLAQDFILRIELLCAFREMAHRFAFHAAACGLRDELVFDVVGDMAVVAEGDGLDDAFVVCADLADEHIVQS